jgi:UDP-glucose 4-epimerase
MEQLDSKNLQFIQSDCSLSYSIKEQLKFGMPNSVIHLASYPNQAAVKEEPYLAIGRMSADTFSVARMAANMSARLVYVSSSMAYGNFEVNAIKEDHAKKPINLYGLLKSQGEDIALQTNTNTVIVRPSAVYGPGDNVNRVLGKWISNALIDEPIIVNDPASLLDFTYVEDAASGLKAAEENGVAGQAYNITRGQARSLGEAALLVKHLTDSNCGIIYNTEKENDIPKRGALDISKAASDLGYKPRVDLQDGIKEYVGWMKNYSHVY